jgi:hypothetical protein
MIMHNISPPTREVLTMDVFPWIEAQKLLPIKEKQSLVVSIPDISEWGIPIEEYKKNFIDLAKKFLALTAESGVSLFYQSDVKIEGEWLSKSYLCQKAAEELGYAQIFHKVIGRVMPDMTTFGRPSYSHILAFSKSFRPNPSTSTPDIISHVGEKVWERGMGINAAVMMAKFLKEVVQTDYVLNPFCGRGTMLAALEYFEISSLGIERSPKRAQWAKEIKLCHEKSFTFNFEASSGTKE